MIAAAAGRLYDELVQPVPAECDLRRFLASETPVAAVVFDGLSLREMPLVKGLAAQSGLRPVEEGWSVAAAPSETVDFIASCLGLPSVGPSQLPTCGALREAGIAGYYLEQVNQRRPLAAAARKRPLRQPRTRGVHQRTCVGRPSTPWGLSLPTFLRQPEAGSGEDGIRGTPLQRVDREPATAVSVQLDFAPGEGAE